MMLSLLVSISLCGPVARETVQEQLLRMWKAVIVVESGGDPRAYNAKEDAAGIASIRPIMLREANRIIGYPKYTLADRWSPVKSYEIFQLVVRYYHPNGGPEQWSRTWNGGGSGAKRKSTLPYWRKIRAQMEGGAK